jgi:hypothetical protein
MTTTGEHSASSPTARDHHIMARLAAAEQDIRRWRRLALLSLIGICALLGVAAAMVVVYARSGFPGTIRESVEAQNFVLRDERGEIRGVLGLTSAGSPQLVFHDGNHRERVTLALTEDGSSGLALRDSAGSSRAVFGLLPDETITIAFADRRGRTRTVLGLSDDESSTLVFADRTGVVQSSMGIDVKGQATFTAEGVLADAGATSSDTAGRTSSRP